MGSLTHQQAGEKILNVWLDIDASDEFIDVYEVTVDDSIDGWYEDQLEHNAAVDSYTQL